MQRGSSRYRRPVLTSKSSLPSDPSLLATSPLVAGEAASSGSTVPSSSFLSIANPRVAHAALLFQQAGVNIHGCDSIRSSSGAGGAYDDENDSPIRRIYSRSTRPMQHAALSSGAGLSGTAVSTPSPVVVARPASASTLGSGGGESMFGGTGNGSGMHHRVASDYATDRPLATGVDAAPAPGQAHAHDGNGVSPPHHEHTWSPVASALLPGANVPASASPPARATAAPAFERYMESFVTTLQRQSAVLLELEQQMRLMESRQQKVYDTFERLERRLLQQHEDWQAGEHRWMRAWQAHDERLARLEMAAAATSAAASSLPSVVVAQPPPPPWSAAAATTTPAQPPSSLSALAAAHGGMVGSTSPLSAPSTTAVDMGSHGGGATMTVVVPWLPLVLGGVIVLLLLTVILLIVKQMSAAQPEALRGGGGEGQQGGGPARPADPHADATAASMFSGSHSAASGGGYGTTSLPSPSSTSAPTMVPPPPYYYYYYSPSAGVPPGPNATPSPSLATPPPPSTPFTSSTSAIPIPVGGGGTVPAYYWR